MFRHLLAMARGAALISLAALSLHAGAAEWPSRPLTLVVPFPAGGSTDAVARLLAQHLGARLGQQVVVENKAGAAGNLGTDLVAKSTPDGHTLALSTSGPLANNRHLYKAMPFDPARDLTPIVLIGETPLVIAVNPGIRANTLKAFFADARARAGKASIANPGNGTIGHLAAELLQSIEQVDLVDVPYKGDTPAMTDVIGGAVDAVSAPVTAFIANIRNGKLKALAVTSRQRFAQLPDVPTAIEQGVDLEATVWFGVVGPARLPAQIVTRLNTELNAILALSDVRERFAQYGASPAGGTAQQFAEQMAGDTEKWRKVIQAARIQIE